MDKYSENFVKCVRDNTNKQIDWLRTSGWTNNTMYTNIKGQQEKMTYSNTPVMAIDRCYRDYKMTHDIQTKCSDRKDISATYTGKYYRECFLDEIKKELEQIYKP